MTLATQSNTDSFLVTFDRLERERFNDDPAWLKPFRKAAIARFAEAGFPTTRDENWRHTNIAPIAETAFVSPRAANDAVSEADLAPYLFGDAACARLVFVNGQFAPKLSLSDDLPDGLIVEPMAAALGRPGIESHWTRPTYQVKHAFTDLNAALFEDGAYIHVAAHKVIEQPIHIVFVSTPGADPFAVHPRNLIVAEPHSQSSIVESFIGLGQGVYFNNTVTDIIAADDAVIDHYKSQRELIDAYHVGRVQIHQARGSNVASHSISLGAAITRNDIWTQLDGEGANCTLNGLFMPRGTQLVDHHLRVDHVKPHCNSWEFFKGILDDRSRGVFCGRIFVHEDAQKTDAKQTSSNLLLSDEAQIDTRPQLEIFADDVRCTHGATIGQMNDEAIFYLRSRGVSEAAARSLLIYAFAGEAVGQIRIRPLREQLQELILERLPHGEQLPPGRPYEYGSDFSKIVRAKDRQRESY